MEVNFAEPRNEWKNYYRVAVEVLAQANKSSRMTSRGFVAAKVLAVDLLGKGEARQTMHDVGGEIAYISRAYKKVEFIAAFE